MPARPFDVEMLLDEGGAITVHRFRQLDRFLFAFAGQSEPADPFVERSVNKEVEGGGSLAKILS